MGFAHAQKHVIAIGGGGTTPYIALLCDSAPTFFLHACNKGHRPQLSPPTNMAYQPLRHRLTDTPPKE